MNNITNLFNPTSWSSINAAVRSMDYQSLFAARGAVEAAKASQKNPNIMVKPMAFPTASAVMVSQKLRELPSDELKKAQALGIPSKLDKIIGRDPQASLGGRDITNIS
ncbi:MAG: hypothetical protein ACQEP8_00040 [Chlamydiota bacterium]